MSAVTSAAMSLRRGEEEQADALGVAGFERAVGLAFLNELEDDREGPLGRLMERSGL
jgi:hypothetical protein